MESIYKIQAIERDLGFKYPRKSSVIHGLFNGLISKHHVLILGPPGVAKSKLVGDFSKVVNGANYFSYLMTNYTTPEELFGPISFSALQNDKFERITNGMLPEANVAMLDEIWKANSSVLNSLLQLVNERKFKNGTQLKDVPLDILIGASNEYPEDSSLNALFDRFLLRFWVDSSWDSNSFATLIERVQTSKGTKQKLSRKEIIELQKAAKNIAWTKENNKMLVEIWSMLNSKQFSFSDRRWVQAIDSIKAEALLSDNKDVQPINFTILKDIMWDNHHDSKKIYGAILKIADEIGTHINELRTIVEELKGKASSNKFEEMTDVTTGVKYAKEKLDALAFNNPNDARIQELQEEIGFVQIKVRDRLNEALGLTPALGA